MGCLVGMSQADAQHMGHILHGQHQREFIKGILFGFSHSVPFYLRPEGFYSLFCGPVFEPLTWSCQATAPHGRLACGPGPCASPAAFSAACGRSGFRRSGTLGRSCPGRSDSCGGATGSLPASQRADGFPPSGSEGTVHTDCLARWIGSANMRLSPRRGEPPYRQGIACPAYTVNYLFRLLPVSIKRDRAPGSTVRDGRTFRADCRMAESAHAFIDTLSKAMWIRRRGYRAVPNQGQPHPGEIVLLLLLKKNRKIGRSGIVNFL